MRCKNVVFSVFLILLCAVIPSMAAEYPIHIDNQSTTDLDFLYISISSGGPGATTQCIALTPNADGSFDTQQDIANNQRINFYTNERCSGRAFGNVTLRVNSDVTKINITITNTRVSVSYENAPKKTIRFFAPWTNTSAILYVAGGDSAKMTAVKNYCGWFETSIKPTEGSFQVYFKQTIGYEYVTDIHNSIKITPIAQSTLLSLDEAAAAADTIWVKAGKDIGATTTVYTKYPGVLGDCPSKTLPVMMFDWLHGTDGDIERDGTVEGTNGDPINGVSADFGSGGYRRGSSRSGGFVWLPANPQLLWFG